MSVMFGTLPDTASVAIWCMVVASLLPLMFTFAAKALGDFQMSDNAHPRQFLMQLTGKAARANDAQKNSYETLPVFLAAVITAMLFFVPQTIINNLAVLYVGIRIAYGIAYIVNLPTFRSILWILSIVCCLMLFYLSARISI